MLIAHRMYHMTAQIGERDVHVFADDPGIAQIQQLAGDQEIVAAGFGFNLQVNLKWIRDRASVLNP